MRRTKEQRETHKLWDYLLGKALVAGSVDLVPGLLPSGGPVLILVSCCSGRQITQEGEQRVCVRVPGHDAGCRTYEGLTFSPKAGVFRHPCKPLRRIPKRGSVTFVPCTALPALGFLRHEYICVGKTIVGLMWKNWAGTFNYHMVGADAQVASTYKQAQREIRWFVQYQQDKRRAREGIMKSCPPSA